MKILWIFLGGRHKIGLYLGVISMHFRVFFKGKVQNGGYFLHLHLWFTRRPSHLTIIARGVASFKRK